MNEVSAVDVKPSNKCEDFIEINLKRTKDGKGVELFLKSQQIFDWVKSHSSKTDFMISTVSGWKDKKGLVLKSTSSTNSLVKSLNNNWGASLMVDGKANTSFLASTELDKGVAFIIEGIYSKDNLDKFLNSFRKEIVSFYKDVLKKDSNKKLVVTMTEVA